MNPKAFDPPPGGQWPRGAEWDTALLCVRRQPRSNSFHCDPLSTATRCGAGGGLCCAVGFAVRPRQWTLSPQWSITVWRRAEDVKLSRATLAAVGLSAAAVGLSASAIGLSAPPRPPPSPPQKADELPVGNDGIGDLPPPWGRPSIRAAMLSLGAALQEPHHW